MKPGDTQESSVSDQVAVVFTEADVELFSEASGDRNPLHLDRAYAQRTPYGQPVVFGCLGALACFGQLRVPSGMCVRSMAADFLRPIFSDVHYEVKTETIDGVWEARLFDGSALALLARATIGADSGIPIRPIGDDSGVFQHAVANVPHAAEIRRGTSTSGAYRCNGAALAALARHWGVDDHQIATALCWSSYLVGMELPGEPALFFRLAFELQRPATPPSSCLRYRASTTYAGFGQIKIEVALESGDSPLVSGHCWSYVRPPVPVTEDADSSRVVSASMAGKVAVITGTSRGLGAAIARALEARGATVYGISRSQPEANSLRVEIGDAANREVLRLLKQRILNEQGRLDYLICNASPPLLPLTLEPNGAERVAEFVKSAIGLTLFPLCEFSDLLEIGEACVVIISSVAVETPVKEWPHYVAAKRAVEALGTVMALQHPQLRTVVVRPDKLITNLTNTPRGHVGAESPKLIARRIAERLENPPPAGKVEIQY